MTKYTYCCTLINWRVYQFSF